MSTREVAHHPSGHGRLLPTLQRLLEIEATGVAEALDQASQPIAEALGADTVDAFFHDPTAAALVAVGTNATPLARRQRVLGLDRLRLAGGGRTVEVFRTGRPRHTGRADHDPEELIGVTHGLGMRSIIAVPLEVDEERRGVLSAASARPDWFSDDDLCFLEAVARWVGTVAQRVELTAQVTQAAAEGARWAVLEELLTYRALHDPLTRLPNRTLLLDRLGWALARTARHEHAVATLFLDLDRFKAVNDTLGHEAGDRLLVAVTERLRPCLRPADTIARLGGDEFVVVLDEVAQLGDATRVAERLLQALVEPVTIAVQQVYISASIGIALGIAGRDSPAGLLRAADLAMYQAKRRGKGRYAVYDARLHAQAAHRLTLEGDLRRAVEREEFVLHYQPKVDLATGKIVQLEALLRWEHPEHGLLLPAEFIGLAEETGLIVPIGRWVLGQVCRQAKMWQERYPADPPLAICANLSVVEFQRPDLVEVVTALPRETGLAARSLRLELTESVLLEDAAGTIATLQELKGLGIELSLDDFGMGYANLSYLKRLPIDILQIDRAFVAGLGKNHQDTAIVEAVMTLAKALGVHVQAEGVETREQVAQLRALGCDVGQGYLFAPPLPSAAVGTLLARGFAPGVAWLPAIDEAGPVASAPSLLENAENERGEGMTADARRTALATIRQQFDQQWAAIFAALAEHDPERAAAVRATLAAPPDPATVRRMGAGFDAARRAWPHLDQPSREAWHQGFAAIWQSATRQPLQAEIIYDLFLPTLASVEDQDSLAAS